MSEWTPLNVLLLIVAFVAGQFALYVMYRNDRRNWIEYRKETARLAEEDAIARSRHP